MKEANINIILALAASFGFGFAFKTLLTSPNKNPIKMKKVTGIGGIFFKNARTQKQLTNGIKHTLGFDTSPYGTKL